MRNETTEARAERLLLKALVELREGQNGLAQWSNVKRRLRDLERRDWIRYYRDGGQNVWYYTATGQAKLEEIGAIQRVGLISKKKVHP